MQKRNYFLGILLSTASVMGMENCINGLSSSKSQLKQVSLEFLSTILRTQDVSPAVCKTEVLQNLLKNKETALDFINFLHDASLTHNFDMSVETLKTYVPFLHKDALSVLKKGIKTRDTLTLLFKQSAHCNNWDKAGAMLKSLTGEQEREENETCCISANGHKQNGVLSFQNAKEKKLFYNCINLHWEALYWGSPAKKTLLSYALELQAPEFVISLLIQAGARLSLNHLRTPPPLVVTVYEFLKSKEKSPVDYTRVLQRIDFLIEKGASLYDSFFVTEYRVFFPLERRYADPLACCTQEGNSRLILYLAEKGALLTPAALGSTENLLLKGKYKKFNKVIKFLLNSPEDRQMREPLIIVCILLEDLYGKNEGLKAREEVDGDIKGLVRNKLLQLLTNDLDSTRSFNGLTALELAKSIHNEEIVTILTLKGAGVKREESEELLLLTNRIKELLALVAQPSNDPAFEKECRRKSKTMLTQVKKLLLQDHPGLGKSIFDLSTLLFDSVGLQESHEFIGALALKEPLFFLDITIDQGVQATPSVFFYILHVANLLKTFHPDNYSLSVNAGCSYVKGLSQQGIYESLLNTEAKASHEAISQGMTELSTCIVSEAKKGINSLFQQTLKNGNERELKALFMLVKRLLEAQKMNYSAVNDILQEAFSFSRWEEARACIKSIAHTGPLNLSFPGYGPVPSVFHALVAILDHSKKNSSRLYVKELGDFSLLLLWLKSEGLKDESLSEGKTAAQKAKELGIFPICEYFTATELKRLEWDNRLFEVLDSEEKLKALFKEARKQVVDNTEEVANLVRLLMAAIRFSCWEESRKLVISAAQQGPATFKTPGGLEVPSLFHLIIQVAYKLKRENLSKYTTIHAPEIQFLISDLLFAGIEDALLMNEKTGAEVAYELGLYEIVSPKEKEDASDSL